MTIRWASFLLLAACGAEVDLAPTAVDGRAIVGGSVDMLHDGVVALVDPGDFLRCSATVIHERVVLTAAHCTSGAEVSWLRIGLGVDGDDAFIDVKEEHVHPGWPAHRAHDIALLALAAPVPSTVSVHRTADAINDPSTVGLDIEVVGYGREDSETGGAGTRRRGTARVTIVEELELAFDPTPASVCFGDSGGPSFASVGAGDDVIGVHSRTLDAQCEMRGFDTRVAPYSADFIRPYLALAGDELSSGSSCALSIECAGALRCIEGRCGLCTGVCEESGGSKSCAATGPRSWFLVALVAFVRRRR